MRDQIYEKLEISYAPSDLSPSLEDYLEEVYRFSLSKPTVRVSDIGMQLQVSAPSVSKALRKLKEKKYINYQKYGDIYLTERGRRAGRFLVCRNQILQNFLQIIASQCNIVEEAEAMEHYLSQTTIQAIQAIVFFMKEHPDVYSMFQDFLQTFMEKKPIL